MFMSKCSIVFDLDGVLCWSINDDPEVPQSFGIMPHV